MLSALDSPPTASLSHLASEMASITPSSVLAPRFGRDEREVRRCAVPIRACCTLVHASLVLLRLHSYSSCSTFMRRGRTSVRIHRTASYYILECESTDPAARARVCRLGLTSWAYSRRHITHFDDFKIFESCQTKYTTC